MWPPDCQKHFDLLIKLFLLTAILLGSVKGWAESLPQNEAVPGGVAVIPLRAALTPPSHGIYNQNSVMILQSSEQWYAIVGIPLGASLGTHSVKITYQDGGVVTYTFSVREKQYKNQYLTFKEGRYVTPDPAVTQRIQREREEMLRAFKTFSPQLYTFPYFRLPVENTLSSEFGVRRFLNNKPRDPHSGIDIRGASGTPVRAAAAGVIIAIGDYLLNGKTVIIDHGLGLITMYCHLSKIHAKLQQPVESGEVIGLVGMTGRSTGPHLHWTVSLNNARVNPVLFLSETDKRILFH